MLKNKSAAKTHNVSVQAVVAPINGAGRSATIVKDSGGFNSGVSLRLDTALNCMVNRFCRDWSNRYAVIAFHERAVTITRDGDVFVLDTADGSIEADPFYARRHSELSTGFYHEHIES